MKTLFLFLMFLPSLALAQTSQTVPPNRVASIYVAQDFINGQLATRLKSELFKSLAIDLNGTDQRIYLRGLLQVPVEELRAINLDPKLGAFRFQASIKPKITKKGYLVLEFPLSETFFYPADSKDPEHEKIVVPVQLLSVALASIRGYLAALSGDFSGFDRRAKKLNALEKDLDHAIKREKNPDALEELKTQRESLRLQLAAIPIERKQLEAMSKQFAQVLGLIGEKELNLNEELGAKKNAIIFKIRLDQLAPYLNGVELGGIRIIRDKKDGSGENFLAIDVNSNLISNSQGTAFVKGPPRPPMKTPPSFVVRLRQSLFESRAVVDAENKAGGSKIRDFDLQFKEDGLHVSGSYHWLLFSVPFHTVVDFVLVQNDVFEIRMRELKVSGMDLEFLSRFVLESVKKRIEKAMKGLCTFEYVGQEDDQSHALRVTVDTHKLIPAFTDLHVIGIDTREREFLLKVGKMEPAP